MPTHEFRSHSDTPLPCEAMYLRIPRLQGPTPAITRACKQAEAEMVHHECIAFQIRSPDTGCFATEMAKAKALSTARGGKVDCGGTIGLAWLSLPCSLNRSAKTGRQHRRRRSHEILMPSGNDVADRRAKVDIFMVHCDAPFILGTTSTDDLDIDGLYVGMQDLVWRWMHRLHVGASAFAQKIPGGADNEVWSSHPLKPSLLPDHHPDTVPHFSHTQQHPACKAPPQRPSLRSSLPCALSYYSPHPSHSAPLAQPA